MSEEKEHNCYSESIQYDGRGQGCEIAPFKGPIFMFF